MEPDNGLIAAFALDGNGGATPLGWDNLRSGLPDGLHWVHLDFTVPAAVEWIMADSGLDPVVAAALVVDETRPRCEPVGDGVLLSLRGVNLNPGQDPEDMVSVRLWVTADRIVSTRRRRLVSVTELVSEMEAGKAPVDCGDFLAQLSGRLGHRINSVVNELEDRVDDLETQAIEHPRQSLRSNLAELRREVLWLRRFLAPQREVLARLAAAEVTWLSDRDRAHLREVAHHAARNVEELDLTRERAAVTQEQLAGAMAEQLNNRTYVLAVVAAVFLPLGFITGLLGINVGGIPLADNAYGFTLVCAALAAGAAVMTVLFKWRKWF